MSIGCSLRPASSSNSSSSGGTGPVLIDLTCRTHRGWSSADDWRAGVCEMRSINSRHRRTRNAAAARVARRQRHNHWPVRPTTDVLSTHHRTTTTGKWNITIACTYTVDFTPTLCGLHYQPAEMYYFYTHSTPITQRPYRLMKYACLKRITYTQRNSQAITAVNAGRNSQREVCQNQRCF